MLCGTFVCQAPGDMAAPRYFSAYGRDVEVPEGRLDLDGSRLLYVGGSSRDADRGQKEAASSEDTLLDALRRDHATRVAEGEYPPIASCSVQWGSQGAVEMVGKAAGVPST